MKKEKNKSLIILVTEPEEIDPEAITLLKKNDCTVIYPQDGKNNELITGLFIRTYTKATKSYLQKFPNLSFILRAGVGLDNIDVEECKRRKIAIYNAPGSNANAVAEYVITTMLVLLRKLTLQTKEIYQGKWRNKEYIGEELQGKIIGLVGCGAIGKLIAKKLQNFDVRILGYDPFIDKETLAIHGIEKHDLSYLLQNADILSLHLPLLAETKNMFTKEKLLQMKKTSYLINTSRGELINEEDLLEILKNEAIAGAVLDVFVNEPNINKEFLSLDNVMVTPHIAGFTKEADKQMAIGAVKNFMNNLV